MNEMDLERRGKDKNTPSDLELARGDLGLPLSREIGGAGDLVRCTRRTESGELEVTWKREYAEVRDGLADAFLRGSDPVLLEDGVTFEDTVI